MENVQQQKLYEQFCQVKSCYPNLEVVSDCSSPCFMVAGTLVFKANYRGMELIEDAYILRIEIPWNFSVFALPKVFEIAGKIDPYYHHYVNGSLCLGVPMSVKMRLLDDCSLLGYIENILVPYLYAHSYFIKYGKMPFGQEEHSDDEYFFYYKEFFSGVPEEKILDFLLVAYRPSIYRMHRPCLCGSGKMLRKCHGKKIKILSFYHPSWQLKLDIQKVVFSLQDRQITSSTMLSHRLRSQIFNEYIRELEQDLKLKKENEKKTKK